MDEFIEISLDQLLFFFFCSNGFVKVIWLVVIKRVFIETKRLKLKLLATRRQSSKALYWVCLNFFFFGRPVWLKLGSDYYYLSLKQVYCWDIYLIKRIQTDICFELTHFLIHTQRLYTIGGA
jgi:hypothetical protein